MNLVQKAFALKLGSIEDAEHTGTFSGTAVPYNTPDESGDVIREGCFRKSITDQEGIFPCLWSHDQTQPLGSVTVDSDTRTLQVRGELLTGSVSKAKEVHALMRARAVRGLSVGFLPIRATPRESGGREFIECRLLEISLCATPSYASAMVHEVRSIGDVLKSLDPGRDREQLLTLHRDIAAMIGKRDEPMRAILKALGSFDPARYTVGFRSKFKRR